MDDDLDITLENRNFSMNISRKAPRFLDEEGVRFKEDPLKNAWGQLQEAFSRLHGQRIMEVMRQLLIHIPENELLFVEQESDETTNFYFRFSNGWSMGSWTTLDEVDQPNQDRFDKPSDAIAPDWFPRDERGYQRWTQGFDILFGTCIDPTVDYLAQDRLYAVCKTLGGVNSTHLDAIGQVVVGPDWEAAIESIEINDNTPRVSAQSLKAARRI